VIILVVIAIVILGLYFWIANKVKSGQVDPGSVIGQMLSAAPGKGSVYWEASHFILFSLLGFFFPCCDAIIIALAAVWELVEHFMGLTTNQVDIPNRGPVQWWYGSAVDVAIDIVGFYVGKSIRLIVSSTDCPRTRVDGFGNRYRENFPLTYFRDP